MHALASILLCIDPAIVTCGDVPARAASGKSWSHLPRCSGPRVFDETATLSYLTHMGAMAA